MTTHVTTRASKGAALTHTELDQNFLTLAQAVDDAALGAGGHASDHSNPHGVTKAQVGLGNVDNTSDADKPISAAQAAALEAKADLTAGKVPLSQLPDAILGALKYQGVWNATTGLPTIPAAAPGNQGWYYKVGTAGTTTIGGVSEWAVGDWVVSNGAAWEKADNSQAAPTAAEVSAAGSAMTDVQRATIVTGEASVLALEGLSAAQRARAQASVSGDALLDLFPLPQMRSILDPSNANIAGVTKPAAATVSVVAAPGEMYGSAIRIDLPAGLTNQRVVIPVLPDIRGNYPKATPKMEWRVQADNWSSLSRVYFWAAEDATATKGHFWVIGDAGQSQFSFYTAAHKSKWDGTYRTMQTSPYFRCTKYGTPSTWDETASEYEVRSVAITVSTTAACAIFLNRVCCPQWARGALVVQLDGCYAASYSPVYEAFKSRRWPGVGSRMLYDAADYMSDAQVFDMASNGWEITQHIARSDATALTATTTESEVSGQIQKWRQFSSSIGVRSQGWRTAVFITNSGRYAGSDMGGVLLKNGITTARGRASDAVFGIDPFDAATISLEWGTAMPSGFGAVFGRYNRWSLPAGDGATVAARNTYSGSNLQKLINRCAVGCDAGWTYYHRVQAYDGVTYPAVDNSSPEFVAGMISHLESLVASKSLVLITPSELDSLTYERPGDIYMRWDGAWVSRSSGSVVI